MVIPGLEGPSSESVTSFLAEMQRELRPRGAYQGASVFGIAAAAGDSIAQDVPAMGAVVDYLAPMVYPSHWGPGMYRVDNPVRQPYDIVKKSLSDFQRVAQSTGVRFLPWLQDFTHRRRALRRARGAGADPGRQGARHRGVPALEPQRRVHRRGPRPAARRSSSVASGDLLGAVRRGLPAALISGRRPAKPDHLPARGARGAFPPHTPPSTSHLTDR